MTSQGSKALARPLDCDWLIRRRAGTNYRDKESLGVTIRGGFAEELPGSSIFIALLPPVPAPGSGGGGGPV